MRLPWELPGAVGTHPNLGDEAFRRTSVDACLSTSNHLGRYANFRAALSEFLHRELPLTSLDDNAGVEVWSLSFNYGLLFRTMVIRLAHVAEPNFVYISGLAFWYAETAEGSPLLFPSRDVPREFKLSVNCPQTTIAETLGLARLDAVRFDSPDLSTDPIAASGSPHWRQR